jgi:hypothetical protein
MSNSHPESVALALAAEGKGILAADETVPTLTKRFQIFGIQSTEQSRRIYREMLFACPDAANSISGAIMFDETIRQKSARPASRPSTVGPVSMDRRMSGSTRRRWRRQTWMTHHIGATRANDINHPATLDQRAK